MKKNKIEKSGNNNRGGSDEKMVEAFPPSNMEFEKKKRVLNNLRARILANDTSLKGLLTYISHKVVPDNHIMFDSVAYTDGDCMYFGDRFFSQIIPIQCAIILHEMFHIVFRHVSRGRKRIHRLWNIANDALINDGIGYKENQAVDATQQIYLPKEHCVSLGSVYDQVGISDCDRKTVSQLTSEELYEQILDFYKEKLKKEAEQQCSSNAEGKNGDESNSGDGAGSSSNGSGVSKSNNGKYSNTELGRLEKEIDNLLDKLSEKHKMFGGDDLVDDGNVDPTNEEINNSIWTERYNRAKSQGLGKGSILGRINPDVYKPQIPWSRELKKYLIKRCMPLTQNTFTRPSRRMASLRVAGTSNSYLPGLEKQKGLDKMMVIIDTSGSCFNEEELSMFCTEIQSVQNVTGVEIALIFADTEIRSESIVKADGTGLLEKIKQGWIRPEGGGGTDMVTPFVEGKKKYKPILTVIASDG